MTKTKKTKDNSSDGSGNDTPQAKMKMAMRYGEKGFAVVPLHGAQKGKCTCGDPDCFRPGNHPRTLEGGTKDRAVIKKNWSTWPKAGIGLDAVASGFIAVTVTTQAQERRQTKPWRVPRPSVWDELNRQHGNPETVRFHQADNDVFLFHYDAPPVRNFAIAFGVTVLGREEFVRLPNQFSKRAKFGERGRRRFHEGYAVGEVAVAPTPNWLERMMVGTDVPESAPTAVSFHSFLVPFDSIAVPEKRSESKIRLLRESIEVTGVRKPLCVRQLPDITFELLSDPNELNALKSLGMISCDCISLPLEEDEGRLWQIAELLHQPELEVLEWAELVMEWVGLMLDRDAQLGPPPGGKQPNDKGLARAGRVLGISRTDMQRAAKIISIDEEAKAEIRRIHLNVQETILQIAREPKGSHLAKVHQICGAEVALVAEAESPVPEIPPQQSASPAEEPGQVQEDSANGTDVSVESPPTAPAENSDGLDIPAALRRDNPTEKLKKLDSIWLVHCQSLYRELPDALRRQFIAERLGYTVTSAAIEANGPDGD